MKPFSQACKNNSSAILNHLSRLLVDARTLLEIGSGTGQHAVYFAEALNDLTWQTSDLIDNHKGIHAWIHDAQLKNVLPPVELDIAQSQDVKNTYDAVFMANTLHIMPSSTVEIGLQAIPHYLNKNGLLIVYGPFNYNGEFTSDSNARFEQWLQATDTKRGIRDFEWVNALAKEAGLTLREDNPMPANNRLLVWQYVS